MIYVHYHYDYHYSTHIYVYIQAYPQYSPVISRGPSPVPGHPSPSSRHSSVHRELPPCPRVWTGSKNPGLGRQLQMDPEPGCLGLLITYKPYEKWWFYGKIIGKP